MSDRDPTKAPVDTEVLRDARTTSSLLRTNGKGETLPPVRPEEGTKPKAEVPSRRANGFAHCAKPERYIQQLVSHWSHKMATSYADCVGTFPFSELESAVMTARRGGIAIALVTADPTRNVHMRGVIERHIDRFAFREAPLTYEWTEA